MNTLDFSFSEMIAGYIKQANKATNEFQIETSDSKVFSFMLTDNTYAELVRNLGESYIDCTGQMREMLEVGRHIFAYGVFYPDNKNMFEVKHIVFSGKRTNEFVFESQDWWIKQIRQLADFYIKAQFGNKSIDFKNYRTMLNLYGEQIDSTRQETDTISRLVYGFASAYMLTGEEKYLEVAEKGSQYLRDHFCMVDTTDDICYWYHAVEFSEVNSKKILSSNMPEVPGYRVSKSNTVRERKMISSEFGDDFDAIPAYEQIYALAGLTQTYRITGSTIIRDAIDKTLNLFDKYYKDHNKGGYFSHIDPITFDPKSPSLDRNCGKKNWNSVGDHAPAYLINLLLATGEEKHKQMLIETADTITEHFQDYENCAFVQEKFYEDWSHDKTWGWQQNRGVVGHNLKIAWNLMRVFSINKSEKYEEFSKKIAALMPKHGGDALRGGWYDVVERELKNGEKVHRYAWHDRKAWWQQEQGILAYLIMSGINKDPEYLKQARESSAFYNAWFLDHDSGAIYFNVLANGLPYLLGNERNKGSHSMSGYHSFELCYLASVYTNLLITKQPMDFFFKPTPNSLKDNILRVAPDLLPIGSIKIESVWINEEKYNDFDANELSIHLPASETPIKVKVRISPTSGLDYFSVKSDFVDSKATLEINGISDVHSIPILREELEKIINYNPKTLVLDLTSLKVMSHATLRSLIFTKQKLRTEVTMIVKGANPEIRKMFDDEEFSEEVSFQE
jgi:mannose/cellobiose epimerase-like protein (N-acyl-D-glucosamine 2-epimerase family)/anti-anti-sigma regulatory factor